MIPESKGFVSYGMDKLHEVFMLLENLGRCCHHVEGFSKGLSFPDSLMNWRFGNISCISSFFCNATVSVLNVCTV